MNAAQPHSLFKVPAPVLAVAVIVVAVFMGGATERMPQGIVLAAMGVLMVVAPPASWPGRWWTLAVLALLALAGTGALPAAFFREGSWRAPVEAAGIAAGDAFAAAAAHARSVAFARSGNRVDGLAAGEPVG